jgi:S-methylmethionine-dependent homocysteine/selenocysteine methylase
LAFETIPEIIECAAIISLLKEFSAADNCPPAWISLACRDASHLNSGATLTDALDVIHHQDPTAELVSGIGVNCCSCDIGKVYVPFDNK